MSKVSAYLQEHIVGEVTSDPKVTAQFTTDGSVLGMKPEMVVTPLVTNDIRKVLRFCWQLAEKGHVLPVTARGGGTDDTGAAIGNGVIIDTTRLHQICEFDAKQKLVRLQSGVTAHTLEQSLKLRGMYVPPLATESSYETVGGAIANNSASSSEYKYESVASWVSEIEVVLANGDVLQTSPLTRRDLNRKKGLQTMEGEIYRSIDNLIEDNKELIDKLGGDDVIDRTGYPGIASVKTKSGFNLAPLLIGSQGTLGIITEMILRCEYSSLKNDTIVLVFSQKTDARDAFEFITKLEPADCEYVDSEYVDRATKRGKKYAWYDAVAQADGALLICGFDDFSDKVRLKKIKKIRKQFVSENCIALASNDDQQTKDAILSIKDVVSVASRTDTMDAAYPAIIDGFHVPAARFEDFSKAFSELAKNNGVTLPIHGDILRGIYSARPMLHLRRVGDKQKVLKLIDEASNLISHHDGVLVARNGEGRLKSKFAYKQLDPDLQALYGEIKKAFDPHAILNPGVKTDTDLRSIAGNIRSDY